MPHIITATVADVLHFSVTRAMLVVTGILFFALRIELYGVCRKMGFSPEGSLLPSLLSLAIVHYYSPLSDFSYLWGVTLFRSRCSYVTTVSMAQGHTCLHFSSGCWSTYTPLWP